MLRGANVLVPAAGKCAICAACAVRTGRGVQPSSGDARNPGRSLRWPDGWLRSDCVRSWMASGIAIDHGLPGFDLVAA